MRYLDKANSVLKTDDLDAYRVRVCAKALDVARGQDVETEDVALDMGARTVARTLTAVLAQPWRHILSDRETWAVEIKRQVDGGQFTAESLVNVVNPAQV